MVKEIYSDGEFQSEIRAPGKLIVVDFFATWCGPCKAIAPFIEQLSHQYSDVNFLKVDEANNRELIVNLGVRAFPTFHFYIAGSKVDELQGADPRSLQSKIDYHRTQIPQSYAGTPMQLGAASTDVDPREARLRRLGQKPVSEEEAQRMITEAIRSTPASAPMDVSEPSATTQMDVAGAEPAEDVVAQLVDMGFSELRSQKALLAGGNLEAAINWLTEHQDDADIDDLIPSEEELNHREAQRLVDEESAMQQVPMTEEEKLAKTDELKQRLATRRAEREAEEKAAELEREKQRREMGKKIGQTSQELAAIQRKRDMEKAKRDKDDAKRERDRLRAEIERDRAERRAHGGKLASKLGVEGYNPSAVQYESTEGAATTEERKEATHVERSTDEQVNWSIERLARYRVGWDGGNALRTARKLIDNVVSNPSEEKFRGVNVENKVLKQKLFGLVGGPQILRAVGYKPSEEDATKLVLSQEDMDLGLLTQTRAKLDAAIDVYSRLNPEY